MADFCIDYYLACLLVSMAVVQIASRTTNQKTLMLLIGTKKVILFSILLILSALLLFFGTENRNINDTVGGLDANQQAFLFTLAVVSSIWSTRFAVLLKNYFVSIRRKND